MSNTHATDITLTHSEANASDAVDAAKEYHLSVRYGREVDGSFQQFPRLRSVYEPIPEEAEFASPIYLLTERQRERNNERVANGTEYQVKTNIAREIQDECENEGRVLNPVLVESDARDEGYTLEEMKRWVADFISNSLPVEPRDNQFYYSGNRSIHAHVPLFVQSKAGLTRLKERATEFNDENDAILDAGIYSRKRQFRLLGVKHRKTGDRKIPVGLNDTDQEISQAIVNTDVEKPDTYYDFLVSVFGQSPFASDNILAVSTGSDSNERSETATIPIQDYDQPPSDPNLHGRYWRHNIDKPVSPYANAEADDTRSVTIVQVIEDVFNSGRYHYCPCEVLGMVGGGGEYTVFGNAGETVSRPVKLSGHDYPKWDYERGDYVVILGGKSHRSILLNVGQVEAFLASTTLEQKGREAAIGLLDEQGYEVGDSGMNGSPRPPAITETTEAMELKQAIERESLDTFDNEEHAAVSVACHLFSVSDWDVTWNWFKREYEKVGRFDSQVTYEKLCAIIDCYSEDYEHIRVPDPPA
jgi:hypothetical protein